MGPDLTRNASRLKNVSHINEQYGKQAMEIVSVILDGLRQQQRTRAYFQCSQFCVSGIHPALPQKYLAPIVRYSARSTYL